MNVILEMWMVIPTLLFVAPLGELLHSQDKDRALGCAIACWPLMIAFLLGHYI